MSRREGMPYKITNKLQDLGLDYSSGYIIKDLYDKTHYGTLYPHSNLTVEVNPSGVVMLRAKVN